MKVLEQIKNYMDENSIPQRYLCQQMKISVATPCYWFKGKRSPRLCDVEQMADVLGLEIVIRGKNET